MLDLKVVDTDQYDLVPVPLPGRLIVFAGPDGLMCRRSDGTITNYPAPGGAVAVAETVAIVQTVWDMQVPATDNVVSLAWSNQDLGLFVRLANGTVTSCVTGDNVEPPVA